MQIRRAIINSPYAARLTNLASIRTGSCCSTDDQTGEIAALVNNRQAGTKGDPDRAR
jgi:hypothetical protein